MFWLGLFVGIIGAFCIAALCHAAHDQDEEPKRPSGGKAAQGG